MKPVVIYLILDESESPRYVGKTLQPRRRPLDHIRNRPVWAKTFRILETVPPEIRWQDRERYWISYYRRFAPLENIARGGGSSGPKSADAIRRQREKVVGRKQSPETLARIRQTIRNRTPEQWAEIGQRISEAKKGRVPNWSAEGKQRTIAALRLKGSPMQGKRHSAETRRLIGEKGKGRAPNSGSFQHGVSRGPHARETIEKIRRANTGKKHTEESRALIRQKRALQVIRHSEETKNKISQAHLGIKLSPDHRARIGQSKLGNTNRLGKTHSLETRRKISETKRLKNKLKEAGSYAPRMSV